MTARESGQSKHPLPEVNERAAKESMQRKVSTCLYNILCMVNLLASI